MANEIIMPKAGMAMEEGTIVKWFKKVGDSVQVGDILLEIETDKVSMEIEAEFSGILLKTLNEPGDVVPVTNVIGYIGEENEVIKADNVSLEASSDSFPAASKVQEKVISRSFGNGESSLSDTNEGKIKSVPAARRAASESGIDLESLKPTGKNGEITLQDVLNVAKKKVTPVAANIAKANKVDPAGITGTGWNEKVTKKDVLEALTVHKKEIPLSPMRKRIAAKMTESHNTVPAFTLFTEAEVGELLKIRKGIKKRGTYNVSINDILIKIVSHVLEDHPRIRSQLKNDTIIVGDEINIGFAVALEDGLIVPVVKEANRKSFQDINKDTQGLIEKAKAGTLGPGEISGSVFTISNLGMFGISMFTPIINVPESAILGVGKIENRVRKNENGFEEYQLIQLSLTVDHRIIDGALGARFLQNLVEYMENPFLMFE